MSGASLVGLRALVWATVVRTLAWATARKTAVFDAAVTVVEALSKVKVPRTTYDGCGRPRPRPDGCTVDGPGARDLRRPQRGRW